MDEKPEATKNNKEVMKKIQNHHHLQKEEVEVLKEETKKEVMCKIFVIYLLYIHHIFIIYLSYIYHIFIIYLSYLFNCLDDDDNSSDSDRDDKKLNDDDEYSTPKKRNKKKNKKKYSKKDKKSQKKINDKEENDPYDDDDDDDDVLNETDAQRVDNLMNDVQQFTQYAVDTDEVGTIAGELGKKFPQMEKQTLYWYTNLGMTLDSLHRMQNTNSKCMNLVNPATFRFPWDNFSNSSSLQTPKKPKHQKGAKIVDEPANNWLTVEKNCFQITKKYIFIKYLAYI